MSVGSFPTYSRCAIYTRQSRETDEDFSSCEAQFEACFQFIRSQFGQGWIYCNLRYDDEGSSGEAADRPGLKRLWADIDAGRLDRVVIHRLDRLSRKVAHCTSMLEELRRRDIALAIVSSPDLGASASDALMLNLFAAFAEFERQLIGERMADARAALTQRGRRVAGVVPYGYRADPATKQLIPIRAEARRVQAMFKRAAAGETARQIAERANRRGWRTKMTVSGKTNKAGGGNRWTPRQVLATLTNPVYAGLLRHGNHTMPGVHQPLVSRELFDQVAEQIASRRSTSRSRSSDHSHPLPLRSLVVCGKCGRRMSPSASGYGTRYYYYYRCRSHAGGRPPCRGVSLPAYDLDQFVCELLREPPPTDGETPEEREERRVFAEAWNALPGRTQTKLLSDVVRRVVYDPKRETIAVELSAGALQAALRLGDLT